MHDGFFSERADKHAQLHSIFVNHARNREVMRFINRAYKPVEGGLHGRGNISAVIGPSRTGKTYGVQQFVSDYAEYISNDGVKVPIVVVDCPVEGGVRAVLESFTDALGITVSPRTTNANLMQMILREVVKAEVEFVIIDEAQEMFPEKNKRLLSFARSFLRKLLNLRRFNIVCIGLPETYSIIAEDSQLIGRGGLPYKSVQPYDWNDPDDRKNFRVLCQKFDEELPFESSGLVELDYSSRLFNASHGSIGLLKNLILAAGESALNEDAPRIERRHFAEVYDERKRPGQTFNPFRHEISTA